MSLTTHLTFEHIAPKSPQNPTLVWLCGYRSNMKGTKVQFLKKYAVARGLGFFCFDYSGHGESSGKLEDGTISKWLNESLMLITQHVEGEIILVGSSMGGWIALRLAELLPKYISIQKMVLIAPAPDFTQDLIWQRLNVQEQEHFKSTGTLTRPSRYSDAPDVFQYSFIEDGKTQLIFNRSYRAHCPVHIMHGTADEDVPISHGHKLMQHLAADNVSFTHIIGGDHRLSRAEDMEVLLRII